MKRIPRIIPVLLLDNKGLYKTIQFKKPVYVGDPLNAVKIFNEKEVDELIFLDISASKNKQTPDLDYLRDIASECFMPLCYGGGVNSIEMIRKLIYTGIEKVALNTAALHSPGFVKDATDKFGSSTIVVSLDVKKNLFGKYEVYNKNKVKAFTSDPVKFAVEMNRCGAGELLLNSVDHEGTAKGYDAKLISMISREVDMPVVACGGAGKISDFKTAYENGASAMAAGSFFVFRGGRDSVLISYPAADEIKKLFTDH